MVYSIWYVVSLGVALGTALFVYYNSNKTQQHTNNPFTYPDYPADGGDSQRSTCSICLNTVTSSSMTRLICGHSFHQRCIDKWLESSCHLAHTCPNCRSPI